MPNNLFNLTAGVSDDGAIDVLAHSSISSQLGVLKEWEYGQVEANLVVPLSRIQSIQPLVKYDVNARFLNSYLSLIRQSKLTHCLVS